MRKSIVRRALVGAAILAVIAVTVMAAAPWTVSSDALRASVARQLEREIGLDLTTAGRTTIAFLPVPRIKLEGVTVATPEGDEVARAGALRARIAWAPLLYGRIRLLDFSLSQARIHVGIDADGGSPWDSALAELTRRMIEGDEPEIEAVGLHDVTITFVDARDGRREVARGVDLTLAWPDPRGPISVSGRGSLRGEVVEVSVAGLVPSELIQGRRSAVDLRVSSRLGRVSLKGALARGHDTPWFAGRLNAETRSAADLLAWLGTDLPMGPLVGPLALDGDATGVGRTLSMPAVRVTLGSDRLDGAMNARALDGRVAVTGTLAADRLDFTRFIAPILDQTDPAATVRRVPLSLAGVTAGDLDLRISAADARAGRLRLADVALSLLVQSGRVEASLSRAELAGGTVRSRFALVERPEGVELRLEGEGRDVDFGVLSRDVGTQWITGRGAFEVDVSGTGVSGNDLLAALDGTIALEIGAGEFVGVDLAEALRRFERQPLTAAHTLRSGRTPFTSASATLVVEEGRGRFVDARFTGARVSGMLEGTLSVSERSIDAKAAVESNGPVGEANLISALTFGFSGPLGNVNLVPDAKALIQRSGAARLLLGIPADAAQPGLAPAAR